MRPQKEGLDRRQEMRAMGKEWMMLVGTARHEICATPANGACDTRDWGRKEMIAERLANAGTG
jgi:hypothetical protein